MVPFIFNSCFPFWIIALLCFFLKLFDVNKKKIASSMVVFPEPLFPVIIVVVVESFEPLPVKLESGNDD